jgi:hypothetical protein
MNKKDKSSRETGPAHIGEVSEMGVWGDPDIACQPSIE